MKQPVKLNRKLRRTIRRMVENRTGIGVRVSWEIVRRDRNERTDN